MAFLVSKASDASAPTTCAQKYSRSIFSPLWKSTTCSRCHFPQAGLASGLHPQGRTLLYVLVLQAWAVPALVLHQHSTVSVAGCTLSLCKGTWPSKKGRDPVPALRELH